MQLEAVGAPAVDNPVYRTLGINAPLLRRTSTSPAGGGVIGAFCFRLAADVMRKLGLKNGFTPQSANFWEAWDHALGIVGKASPAEWESARRQGLRTRFVWRHVS